MLKLLLQYRLIYYRHFIHQHFTRRVKIELGLIALLLVYLIIRSPADIGYNIQFLGTEAFNTQWPLFWLKMLPFLYVIFEILAYFTMRPTGDWNILGTLPLPKITIIHYHLLRYTLKTGTWLMLGTLLFLGGTLPVELRLFNALLGLIWLVNIKYMAFLQAFHLRSRTRGRYIVRLIWLGFEFIIIAGLYGISKRAPMVFQGFSAEAVGAFLAGIVFVVVLAFLIQRWYQPAVTQFQAGKPGMFNRLFERQGVGLFMQSPTGALLVNDLLFLLRRKRLLFASLLLEMFILLAAIVSQKEVMDALVSSVFIQILVSWLLVMNLALILFERDAEFMGITRVLPLSVSQIWGARWLVIFSLVALPVVIPYVVIFFKFPIIYQFWIFLVMVGVVIPGLMATFYCNTGFALFPQAKLTAYVLNISILLMILFWFYMPFGSLILLGITLIWIRKAQKHFQRIEIL